MQTALATVNIYLQMSGVHCIFLFIFIHVIQQCNVVYVDIRMKLLSTDFYHSTTGLLLLSIVHLSLGLARRRCIKENNSLKEKLFESDKKEYDVDSLKYA